MPFAVPLRLSPFLPGCYVQLDADDARLYPAMRALCAQVVALYDCIQRCGLAERRARLDGALAPGITFGPLAVPFAPAFTHLGQVATQLERVAEEARTWRAGSEHGAYNRRCLQEVTAQVSAISASLLAHCADCFDVPPDFARERLDGLESQLRGDEITARLAGALL